MKLMTGHITLTSYDSQNGEKMFYSTKYFSVLLHKITVQI